MPASDSPEGDGPWDQVPGKRHAPRRQLRRPHGWRAPGRPRGGGPQAAFHAEGVCLWLSACRPRKPARGGWLAVPAHPRGLVPLPRVRGRWEILTQVDGLSII